ncbi:hypothetical protein [Uliginosibacterium sp. TH139]|uniref:hypothetical protein n=1 Tax=Uliginosibacterium sp. TH139 TaxID=2067453 RepID=UPI000C7D7C29|nr:hypothetical protein [Uliginosibacterium sp. TH139]PLK50107.1 hypothetical protein C0V76_06790 [Uliginosibacterium sp. TH139]
MRFLPLILLCLSLPALAGASPEEAASAFYSARVGTGSLGAPGGLELANYSGNLGPELVCLLGAARRYSEAFSKTHPTETAPFEQGDLYSGAPALPNAFNLGKASIKGERATLGAGFAFEDGIHREATLQLRMHKRHWVIHDIEFSQPDALGLGSPTLIAGLRALLEKNDDSIGWNARELSGCPQGNELARLQAEKKKSATKKSSKKSSAGKKTTASKSTSSASKKTSKTPAK